MARNGGRVRPGSDVPLSDFRFLEIVATSLKVNDRENNPGYDTNIFLAVNNQQLAM